MTGQPHERNLAAAMHTPALPDADAADLRAELLKLRKQLHDVESGFSACQATQLQEANQKLVLAVLQAEGIAESAVARLAAATDSHHHDHLTGLPNRALGSDRLANAIGMARHHEKRLAVLFVDLDAFKAVNDNLGHADGDQVLQMVTKRLQSVLGDSDTIIRYGGDEFLIILPDISDASDGGRIAGELLAVLSVPSNVSGHMLRQSASIGISLYPDDGETAAILIDRADAAMYRCKRRGTGRFQFYTEPDVDEGRDVRPTSHSEPAFTLRDQALANSTMSQQNLREANERLVISSLAAQESEAQAKNAYHEQLTFMAMVAHELRNPLTPLGIAADMLSNRSDADDISTERLVEIITSQVARMARLIDDLLDGSRLSTGKLRLEFETVDLIGVVDQVIMVSRPTMESREQHLSVALLPGPLTVRGDPIRLAQIFNNLLENACKYTPQGGAIELEMVLIDHSVSISVRDNGLGISAETLPRVFDLFRQDAHALPHSSGGLGVGLAVVRELVKAHGGTVVAHSAGHHLGSEFVVTLPLS